MDDRGTSLSSLEELTRILSGWEVGLPHPERDELSVLAGRIHAADLADLLGDAPEPVRRILFQSIPEEDQPEVLARADEKVRSQVLSCLSEESKVSILADLAPDDAADVLGDLTPAERDSILLRLAREDPGQAQGLKELAAYPPDTAGGLMNPEFLAFNVEATVRSALMQVKTTGDDWEDLSEVFVVDDQGRLSGAVALDDLLRARLNQVLGDVMETEPVSVHVGEDSEEAAQKAVHYRLPMLPVVDDGGQLVGAITFDDVMQALGEEASEDMYRLAGTLEHNPVTESQVSRLLSRFPFLMVTILGSYLMALLIGAFYSWFGQGDQVSSLGIVPFIPMIAALAGNAGLQTSTTMIRGFATGDVRQTDLRRMLARECTLGAMTGIASAAVGLLLLLLGGEGSLLRMLVPICLWVAVIVATFNGTLIPFFCLRVRFRLRGREVKFDPALAAGPFITTLNDIASTGIALGLFFFLGGGE